MLYGWKKEKGNKYVLYGPPAVGKNTLARLVPTKVKDASVIHLEEIEKNCRQRLLGRLAYLKFTKPLFVTAADLDPKNIPPEFEIVFIIHETFNEYKLRYDKRNEEAPEKKGQEEEKIYKSMDKKRRDQPQLFKVIVTPKNFEGNPSGLLDEILKQLGIDLDLG